MLCFRLLVGVFVMLISAKVPTHVGILTFMIMINFVLGLFKKKIMYEDILCF